MRNNIEVQAINQLRSTHLYYRRLSYIEVMPVEIFISTEDKLKKLSW